MTDPDTLKTTFKDFLEREDTTRLREFFTTHKEAVEFLDLPLFSFGAPAVVYARDNLPLVDVLMEFGADINARNKVGKTPVALAAVESDRAREPRLRRRCVATATVARVPRRA